MWSLRDWFLRKKEYLVLISTYSVWHLVVQILLKRNLFSKGFTWLEFTIRIRITKHRILISICETILDTRISVTDIRDGYLNDTSIGYTLALELTRTIRGIFLGKMIWFYRKSKAELKKLKMDSRKNSDLLVFLKLGTRKKA